MTTCAPTSAAVSGRRLTGDAGIVAGWTLASRVTGFLRIAVIGAVFGPTILANLYQATNVLPNIAYNLMAGSLIVSLLVPSLVGLLRDNDDAEAKRLAGAFFGVTLLLSATVGVVVIAAEPILSHLLTLGADDAIAADAHRTVRFLLLLVVPQIALYATAGVAMAAQNAKQRFALAAGAPVLENVGVIATVIAFAAMGGGGIEADHVTTAQLAVLGVGSTLAVAGHAALQWWGAARAGLLLLPNFAWRDPELRAIVGRGRSALAQAVAHASVLFILIVAAATVPGGVVAFQLALQTVQLPIALGARPIAVALLPRLSSHQRTSERARFLDEFSEGLWLSGIIAIPAAMALAAFGYLIGSTIAIGRMGAGESYALVAVSMISLAPSILGETLSEMSRSALFARDNFTSPALASWVRAGVVGVGAGVASLGSDPLVVLGILGCSMAAADLLSGHLLLRRLSRELGASALLSTAWMQTVWPATVAVGSGAAIAWSLKGFVGLPEPMALVIGAAGSVVVYLIVEQARSPQFGVLTGQIRDAITPHLRRIPLDVHLLVIAVVVLVLTNLAALQFGVLVLGALGAIVTVGVVVSRPVSAAYIYAALLPLLAGMERGRFIPLARPNEALLLLLLAGLAIRAFGLMMLGHRPALRPTRLDWSLLGFALIASAFPILWMFARGITPELNDLLEPVVVWRLAALYMLVRLTITSETQIRRTLTLLLGGAAAIAVLAVVQALGLLGGGGEALLVTFWGPPEVLEAGRASTTLASSLATGDYLAYALAVAVAWWCWRVRTGSPRTTVPAALATLLLLGALASGQFSGWFAAVSCAAIAAHSFGMLRRLALVAAPVVFIGAIVTWPVLSGRLSGFGSSFGVPRSWLGRVDNVATFYLPQLGDFGFVLGVRPNSTIPAPETWREEIFLESGYLWFFWVGGIPLFLAFIWLMWRGLDACRTVLRQQIGEGPTIIAAVAARACLVTLIVLTLIDKHLQLRGAGDLLIIVLALAVARSPARTATGRAVVPTTQLSSASIDRRVNV